MKKTIIFLILLVLIVPIVMSGGYMEPVTKGYLDTNFCMQYGVCTFNTLTVYNLSVIGEVFNVTMNLVTWNITENFNVGGNLQAENVTADNFIGNGSLLTGISASSVEDIWVNETYEIGNQTFAQTVDGKDIELRLETDTNERAYLYYMESDSGILGFRAWYDGHGGGTYKIDAIGGAGEIIPKIEIDRDDYDFDFFVNEDLNDNNITNVQCIELDGNVICSWDDVNISGDGGNTTQEIWNVIDNGTFQYLLQNSSNITCIGNQCFYNGSTGVINISDLINVDTAGVGNLYILAYHEPSGFWRATSSGLITGWNISTVGDFLYNDTDTLYFNYTKLDDEYVTYADFNKEIWGTQNITTRTDMIVWGRYCNRTNCYTVTDFLLKTSDSNASTACDDGEYLDGNGGCILFNDTIKKLFTQENIVYNATSIATEVGILDMGNLASVQILADDNSYNVSEVSGVPGFLININFTNITSFNTVALRGRYEGGGGDTLALEIYRVGVGWEERAEITDQLDWGVTTFPVFIGSNFINTTVGDGTVQLRINHDDTGKTAHDYFLDAIFIGQVPGLITGGDLADLTGRERACILLPTLLCRDGSRNMTGQLNGTSAVFTGSVGIGTSTPGNELTVIGDVNATGSAYFNRTYIGWVGDTDARLSICSDAFPPLLAARNSSFTQTILNPIDIQHITTGTAVDGFGVGISFSYKDDDLTRYKLAGIDAFRSGADDLGALQFTLNPGDNVVLNLTNTTANFQHLDVIIDGMVGIGGESNPLAPLHIITNGSGEALRIEESGAGTESWSLGTENDGDLAIIDSGVTRITFQDGTGNIGIGTPTPTSELHVNGSANITGIIYLNGSSYISTDGNGNIDIW